MRMHGVLVFCWPTLIRSESLQVLLKLTHISDWTFNTFRLAELTNGKPLSTLSFAVLKQSGIVSCLKLDEHKLAR